MKWVTFSINIHILRDASLQIFQCYFKLICEETRKVDYSLFLILYFYTFIFLVHLKAGINAAVLGSQFMQKLMWDIMESEGGIKRYNNISIMKNTCKKCLYTSKNKVNLLQHDLILIFINHGCCHWTLLVWRKTAHLNLASKFLMPHEWWLHRSWRRK